MKEKIKFGVFDNFLSVVYMVLIVLSVSLSIAGSKPWGTTIWICLVAFYYAMYSIEEKKRKLLEKNTDKIIEQTVMSTAQIITTAIGANLKKVQVSKMPDGTKRIDIEAGPIQPPPPPDIPKGSVLSPFFRNPFL